MAYGLNKATNYYNRIAAYRDYVVACRLTNQTPAEGSDELGWRRLDKLTEKLLAGASLTQTDLRAAVDKAEAERR